MHPLFKDNVSGNEILFKNLNKICLVIPGFEVANCVLVPLNGMMIHFQKFLSLPRKKKHKTYQWVRYEHLTLSLY